MLCDVIFLSLPGEFDIPCFTMAIFHLDDYHWQPNVSNDIKFKFKTSQKSDREGNITLNTQKVIQELLFSELSDRGDMQRLFQIFVSYKYYMNFKIWLRSFILFFHQELDFAA